MRASGRAATFFPLAASSRTRGLQGVSGARHGLRHEGAMQECEEESCWKSGRGRVRLYNLGGGLGLADEGRLQRHTVRGGAVRAVTAQFCTFLTAKLYHATFKVVFTKIEFKIK